MPSKERYWKDPGKYIALQQAYHASLPPSQLRRLRSLQRIRYLTTPKRNMLKKARGRAKRLGLPMTITQTDFELPEFCPVLGIKIVISQERMTDGSPTLDRIIPSEGYVPGNVRVISYRANRIKNDATLQELEAIVAYVKRETGVS